MRRFNLERKEDESGVSGIGLVAQGIEFDTGEIAMCWLTSTSSIGIYHNIKAVQAIHGHGGATIVVWVDDDDVNECVTK